MYVGGERRGRGKRVKRGRRQGGERGKGGEEGKKNKRGGKGRERVEGVEGKKRRYRIPVCGRIHPDPLAPDSDWLPFPYRRAYKALGPGLEPILR